ncbi:hypothetical protein GPUN_2448 [Glaciecola punicea ACAM 611]|uniref:N-acetyltransferase domain-containing protein n=1 Tax=Glaciecola punicea ACAM 611 TaxID=1121923 RepID=H5TE36_9ALTE|nr:peptidase C39 family protein [Glaciecola punicea]GAB56563.1 hypothetical protein GPUN_2448 [Glaciecola punicea ACAM 611]
MSSNRVGVTRIEAAFRQATMADVNALTELENTCFQTDRLSRRQFKYWIKAQNKVLLLATINDTIVGYGLVILRKGTSLARLYSLALLNAHRGKGIAGALMRLLEEACIEHKRAYLRLEVSEKNATAISLYASMDYKKFGYYPHYYEDDSNAVRMQKPIMQGQQSARLAAYPYYAQSTEFTCGPASLLMAMAKLDNNIALAQNAELDIWRTATTIFMTSGHGGCHPLGLAIAGVNNGFSSEVFINQEVPLFLAGVRQAHKKDVIAQVEHDFVDKAQRAGVKVNYKDYTTNDIADALNTGASVMCLLSSYQFDGFKGPHWVAVTHIDEDFMYIHDPDIDFKDATQINEGENDSSYRQHVPVSLLNFERYTRFGKAKLRTALILRLVSSSLNQSSTLKP